MKKNIIRGLAIIGGIIGIMFITEIGAIATVNYCYDKKVDELEESIYNIMNKKDYDITIEVDDGVHTYRSVKDGLFRDYEHIYVKK